MKTFFSKNTTTLRGFRNYKPPKQKSVNINSALLGALGFSSTLSMWIVHAYAQSAEDESKTLIHHGAFFPIPHHLLLTNELDSLVENALLKSPDSTLINLQDQGNIIADLLKLAKCDDEILKQLTRAKEVEPLDTRIDAKMHLFLVFMALIQNAFILPFNKERGDWPDPPDLETHSEKIWLLFSKLKITQEQPIDFKSAALIVVQGGFSFRMWGRVEYLFASMKKYGEEKLSGLNLHFAAGDRKLDTIRDIEFLKNKLPADWSDKIEQIKDEAGAAKLIMTYFFAQTPKLSNLAAKTTYGYAVAALEGRNRATGVETALATKASHPHSAETGIILVSNAPYWPYQLETNRAILSDSPAGDRQIVAAGFQAPENTPLRDFYDSLSRQFFTSAVLILKRTLDISQQDAVAIAVKYKKTFNCQSLLTEMPQNPETGIKSEILRR